MDMVRLDVHAGVATLTLDRPPVNAIDNEFLEHAEVVLSQVGKATELRSLIITGAGRSFSAGLDLKVVPKYGPAEQRQTINGINRLVALLYSLPLPTIAAVNGHAIAGGLVLALSCDYRIGTTDECLIGLTEARAGIPFPAVAMAVVRDELAPAVARRLTLMARNYGPQAALADGILDELQPAERVLPRAYELAADLAHVPPDAYARIKHQLRAATIAECQPIVESGRDPLADAWLSTQAATASAALLGQNPKR